MADLAVSHLPLGQAHRQAAGLQGGRGELPGQGVHAGRPGDGDGVGLALGADAPTVEDHEEKRLGLRHESPFGEMEVESYAAGPRPSSAPIRSKGWASGVPAAGPGPDHLWYGSPRRMVKAR